MKKALALLLCTLALLTFFTACGDKPTEVTTALVAEDTTPSDPNLPDIPENIGDISGDFHILVAGNWAWNDYESDGEDGTVTDTAIYRRNKFMEEEYGVNITNEDIVKYSSAMGSGDGFQRIYTDYMAGDDNFGAAMIGTYDVATLAYNGYIHDLNDMNYIDLSKSYWDQKANEDLAMMGKMYYTTGDISVADNRATYVLFFSKSMIEEYGMENPYDLVRDNKWTLDKFGSMVKSVGEDVNQDGVYASGDVFGLMTPTDTHLAILSAADERICTVDDEGKLALTFYSERVVNLYDKYLEIVGDHAHSLNYQFDYVTGANRMAVSAEDRISMFNTNKALFYSHTMFYMDNLRDLEGDFGILPYPKFDAEQENYRNLVSAWHGQFVCVPESVQDLDRSGIILELLAYKGKELLTPAYYEKTLVGQYTRDEESAEMLDLIFANLVYDLGIYYNIGTYKSQLTAMVRTGQSLTTIYETYRSPAEVKIEQINEFFAQNAAGGEKPAVTKAPETTAVPETTEDAPAVEPITGATVVYVKDGASGSGESADSALAKLSDAYAALDKSKDCTVVICGPYTQTGHFDVPGEFDGSVTITSVYDGKDYREDGAIYRFEPSRFYVRGATAFEHIDFEALGTNLLVLAQFHPVTVGEGVTMAGDDMTGGSVAKAFCIVGGYQKDTVDAVESSDADTHITVLSGSKLYIVPFTRQIAGTYTGTANIHIGGNADVSVLHGSSAYPDGITVGDVKVTITDDAHVGVFYGCTQDTTAGSYEFNWESGAIDKFEWVCGSTPGKTMTVTNGSTLIASETAKQAANFATIAENFDTVK